MNGRSALPIVGYVSDWSIASGERISLHVSCETAEYDVSVVRLRHGDLHPEGPGFRAENVSGFASRTLPGRHQPLHVGSCVIGPSDFGVPEAGFSLGLWLWPTTPALGREQAIAGWRDEELDDGVALVLSEDGEVCLRTGAAGRLGTGFRLRRRAWYYLAAAFDDETATVTLLPRDSYPGDPASGSVTFTVATAASRSPFVVGACSGAEGFTSHFNGKVEDPSVYRGNGALAPARVRDARESDALLSWNLARDQASATAVDVSASGRDGVLHNCPTRAVTDHSWSGLNTSFLEVPEEYGALWLHDDDLDDAQWDVDLELHIPDDWPSAIYAFRLKAVEDESLDDYVPFVVRPRGARRGTIALLVPTLTYLAYANEHMWARPQRLARLQLDLDEFLRTGTPYEKGAFSYIIENRLHSIYDDHSDGSGVAYSSRRRPVLNFRPRYNKPALRFKHPHLLNCDLYLIDWLTELGFDFVCITDEDLHREGYGLLEGYSVIMTGTHPEYWTLQMLDSLDRWLDDGGRLLYLGGNGFYWATSIDAERPWILEQRRGETGSRAWTSEPGEFYHSTTGELGGLWRFRGRPPQARLGVGFTAQCGDARAQPYRRTPASRDPRAAFIFEGVDDELIGDFGIHMGGAAGWELDRADRDLGTPPHALVLASSFGHSDAYHHVIEEELASGAATGGQSNPLVRADLTYFEGMNGGAVFSTGSISWSGSLSHNGYDNSVSQIMANVLRRFLDPEPIPPPPREAFDE